MMLQMVHDHTATGVIRAGFNGRCIWMWKGNGKTITSLLSRDSVFPKNTDKSKMPPLETEQKQNDFKSKKRYCHNISSHSGESAWKKTMARMRPRNE